MLLHARRKWPEAITTCFWPLALSYQAHLLNHLTFNDEEKSPMELLIGEDLHFDPADVHTFGCPVYILDARLQNNNKIPRWDPRCRLGIFEGYSPHHSSTVALVMNPQTGLISPQYHVVFDDHFSTVESLRSGATPHNWKQLYKDNVLHVHHEDTSQDPNHIFLFDTSEIESENEGGMEMPDLVEEDDSVSSDSSVNEGEIKAHEGDKIQYVNFDKFMY